MVLPCLLMAPEPPLSSAGILAGIQTKTILFHQTRSNAPHSSLAYRIYVNIPSVLLRIGCRR
jgi:hypothetical protein